MAVWCRILHCQVMVAAMSRAVCALPRSLLVGDFNRPNCESFVDFHRIWRASNDFRSNILCPQSSDLSFISMVIYFFLNGGMPACVLLLQANMKDILFCFEIVDQVYLSINLISFLNLYMETAYSCFSLLCK